MNTEDLERIRPAREPSRTEGFTLIELLVVVAVIGLLSTIAVGAVQNAVRRARVTAVAAEGKVLHHAFHAFYVDQGTYPNATSNPSFRLDTFEPLRGMGYYTGNVASKLDNGRADSFDSPNDMGSNREFWLVMSPRAVSGVKIVVADSDDAPMVGGQWLDGVYIFDEGVLTPVDRYRP